MNLADNINLKISAILADALSGDEKRYRYFNKTGGSFVRWGLVEREIHLTVLASIGGIQETQNDG